MSALWVIAKRRAAARSSVHRLTHLSLHVRHEIIRTGSRRESAPAPPCGPLALEDGRRLVRDDGFRHASDLWQARSDTVKHHDQRDVRTASCRTNRMCTVWAVGLTLITP